MLPGFRTVRLYEEQKGSMPVKIFMVHGDEANSGIPNHLSEDIPFYAFHHLYPDLTVEQFPTIEEIASNYVDCVLEEQPQGPYFLSGYSIGGIIAYEMAQQLQSRGKSIAGLILVDTKAAELTGKREFHNRQLQWDRSRTYNRFKKWYRRMTIRYCRIIGRPLRGSLRAFYLMEHYREARSNYRTQKFSGDVTLIRSTINNFRDPSLGWKPFVQGRLKVEPIETDHHHITLPPAIEKVASIYESTYRAALMVQHPSFPG